jgi:hypothetical protein
MITDRVARAGEAHRGEADEIPPARQSLAPGSAPPIRARTRAARILTALRDDAQLRRRHDISDDELAMLAGVSLMGDVQCPSDLVFILNVLRAVLKTPDAPPVARS